MNDNLKINHANKTNLIVRKSWQTRTTDSRDTRWLARHSNLSGPSICDVLGVIADESVLRLAGYGAAHAAPRKIHDETDYHTLGAGCVGYAEDSRRKGAPLLTHHEAERINSTAKKDFAIYELGNLQNFFMNIKCLPVTQVRPPTACVSCGGWESGLALETAKTQSQENAKKRAAYPPSAARCVGRFIDLP